MLLDFKSMSNNDLKRLIPHALCHYSDIQSSAISVRKHRTSTDDVLHVFCYHEVLEHKYYHQYSTGEIPPTFAYIYILREHEETGKREG